MRSLRPWQQACIDNALEHYRLGHSHFLCLATPGSGKTLMAASLARELLQGGKIDIVLCFSPSVTVAENMKDTFAQVMGVAFNGLMGAKGRSLTYQSLTHLDDDFWSILNHQRALVVFDEIHHCAGHTAHTSNRWGQQIMERIQEQARFTLALSGTPWRSDKLPIVLQRYELEPPKIICHYQYGLEAAVTDGVCRLPKIVAVDNESITVTDDAQNSNNFASFTEAFHAKALSYQSLLKNEQAIRYLIGRAHKRITLLRQSKPNAAGLIVATDVAHAYRIADIIEQSFGQPAEVVTYQTPDAQSRIRLFKDSNTPWIVSVGMISEGTDIPRLQVCCHLSRIKTELYFRQVLGRILRQTPGQAETAWLYTFAEPNMVTYAERLDNEIPDQSVLFHQTMTSTDNLGLQLAKATVESSRGDNVFHSLGSDIHLGSPATTALTNPWSTVGISLSHHYRERVILAFSH